MKAPTAEEEQAYQVLGNRFGFPPAYIRLVLEDHFESPSDAGIGYGGSEDGQESAVHEDGQRTIALTLTEIRDSLYLIDRLRAEGRLPPLKRHIKMDRLKQDKRGRYYVATEGQLQEELRVQEGSGIDPDGNLVVEGKIVQHGWLQSHTGDNQAEEKDW